jgi:hypothetical protein
MIKMNWCRISAGIVLAHTSGMEAWKMSGSRSVTSLVARQGLALGATAIGAFAIGAVAIGALVIRKVAIRDGRIDRLSIGELTVDRLVIRDSESYR